MDLNQIKEALEEVKRGRDIMGALVAIAPGNTQWRNELVLFDREIARLQSYLQPAGQN
jgi:hypothetical protein